MFYAFDWAVLDRSQGQEVVGGSGRHGAAGSSWLVPAVDWRLVRAGRLIRAANQRALARKATGLREWPALLQLCHVGGERVFASPVTWCRPDDYN